MVNEEGEQFDVIKGMNPDELGDITNNGLTENVPSPDLIAKHLITAIALGCAGTNRGLNAGGN